MPLFSGFKQFEECIDEYCSELIDDIKDDEKYAFKIKDKSDEFDLEYVITIEPDYIVYEWDDIGADVKNTNRYELYENFIRHYNDGKDLSFGYIFYMLKELKEVYDCNYDFDYDSDYSFSLTGIFLEFLCEKVDSILGDFLDKENFELEEVGEKYEVALEIIQKAWKKCRWNPKYKICWNCQLKGLENIGVILNPPIKY